MKVKSSIKKIDAKGIARDMGVPTQLSNGSALLHEVLR